MGEEANEDGQVHTIASDLELVRYAKLRNSGLGLRAAIKQMSEEDAIVNVASPEKTPVITE